jgi:hypothetical protein
MTPVPGQADHDDEQDRGRTDTVHVLPRRRDSRENAGPTKDMHERIIGHMPPAVAHHQVTGDRRS